MNKLFRVLPTSLFFLSSLSYSFSCSCAGYATFCESASASGIILEVEVEKIYEAQDSRLNFIDFKVNNEIFNNTISTYSNMTFAEYGSSCDIFLSSNVKVGDKLIVTFRDTSELIDANFTVFDFPFCSVSHLTLSNGRVRGFINNDSKETSMSYSKFKDDVLDLCNIDFLGPTSVILNSNLTEGNFSLTSDFEEELDFDILDASGRLAINGMLLPGEEKFIEISDLPAGVYFIRFRSGQNQVVKKVVKV